MVTQPKLKSNRNMMKRHHVANELIKGPLIVLVQQRWSMKLEKDLLPNHRRLTGLIPKINWVNIEKND